MTCSPWLRVCVLCVTFAAAVMAGSSVGGCIFPWPVLPTADVHSYRTDAPEAWCLRYSRSQFTEMDPGTEIVVVRYYTHYVNGDRLFEFVGAESMPSTGTLSYPLRFELHFTGIPWLALGGYVTQLAPGVIAFTKGHWPAGDAHFRREAEDAELLNREHGEPILPGPDLAFFPRSSEMSRDRLMGAGLWPMAVEILEKECDGFIRTVRRSRLTDDQKAMVFRQMLDVIEYLYDPTSDYKGETYPRMIVKLEEALGRLEPG